MILDPFCYNPIFLVQYNELLHILYALSNSIYLVINNHTLCFYDICLWSNRKAWLLTTTFLFFSSFLFPPKKEGRRKGKWIAEIVIKSHAFLLDLCLYYTAGSRGFILHWLWWSSSLINMIYSMEKGGGVYWGSNAISRYDINLFYLDKR